MERIASFFTAEPRDRDELLELLRDAERRNLLDPDALNMIEGVMQVSEMQVRDIMIPRSQVVALERDAPVEALFDTIVESGHSRFPVIGDNLDEIVGILLAKDMLRYCREGDQAFDIREVLRPAIFIPESKRLNVLLKEFRASRNHMAMVVDEYGGLAGLVTIEDVLEQIVGEIADEHDIEEGADIVEHGNQLFSVKAITPIEEFNDYFGSDFSDEEFDTIGGLVMQRLGSVPKPGETVELDGLRFKVLRADSRRIQQLQVQRIEADA